MTNDIKQLNRDFNEAMEWNRKAREFDEPCTAKFRSDPLKVESCGCTYCRNESNRMNRLFRNRNDHE